MSLHRRLYHNLKGVHGKGKKGLFHKEPFGKKIPEKTFAPKPKPLTKPEPRYTFKGKFGAKETPESKYEYKKTFGQPKEELKPKPKRQFHRKTGYIKENKTIVTEQEMKERDLMADAKARQKAAKGETK